MSIQNEMKVEFTAKSNNESFARVVVASFVSQLDPTLEELSDIKTAVSEAVTNAIIHGYENTTGKVYITCKLDGDVVEIEVRDEGKGIDDVELARQPLFTSQPQMERSGMGFTVMETFMDKLEVESSNGEGTVVKMVKRFKNTKEQENI